MSQAPTGRRSLWLRAHGLSASPTPLRGWFFKSFTPGGLRPRLPSFSPSGLAKLVTLSYHERDYEIIIDDSRVGIVLHGSRWSVGSHRPRPALRASHRSAWHRRGETGPELGHRVRSTRRSTDGTSGSGRVHGGVARRRQGRSVGQRQNQQGQPPFICLAGVRREGKISRMPRIARVVIPAACTTLASGLRP